MLADVTATQYKALAARCSYIAIDRADAQYCGKGLRRDMSVPTLASWARLRRLARYALGRPRAIIKFDWQPDATHIDIFTDANWAVCKTARKSTSGVVAMVGSCCIQSWSKTQILLRRALWYLSFWPRFEMRQGA